MRYHIRPNSPLDTIYNTAKLIAYFYLMWQVIPDSTGYLPLIGRQVW